MKLCELRPITIEELRALGITCDTNDASRIINHTPRWTEQLAAEGKLPAKRVGRGYRYDVRKLAALVGIEY